MKEPSRRCQTLPTSSSPRALTRLTFFGHEHGGAPGAPIMVGMESNSDGVHSSVRVRGSHTRATYAAEALWRLCTCDTIDCAESKFTYMSVHRLLELLLEDKIGKALAEEADLFVPHLRVLQVRYEVLHKEDDRVPVDGAHRNQSLDPLAVAPRFEERAQVAVHDAKVRLVRTRHAVELARISPSAGNGIVRASRGAG